jgi:hypothetical protein
LYEILWVVEKKFYLGVLVVGGCGVVDVGDVGYVGGLCG